MSAINYRFTLPANANLNASTNPLQKRKDELSQKVRAFEQKLGMSAPCTLEFEGAGGTPHAEPISHTCVIPSWFLLKQEDIPQHLRITNMQDPRLNDKKFLNEMLEWMNGKIKEIHQLGLSTNADPINKKTLRFLIGLMSDPEGFEKSKDFVVAHELSHLSHDLKGRFIFEKIKEFIVAYAPIALCVASVVLSAALLIFSPLSFLSVLGISLGVGVLVGAINVSISIGNHIYNTNNLIPFMLKEEKQADMDAQRILRDSAGGVHFFEKVTEFNKEMKKRALDKLTSKTGESGLVVGGVPIELPSISITDPCGSYKRVVKFVTRLFRIIGVDEEGNNTGDVTHPSLTDRIKYLKEIPAGV